MKRLLFAALMLIAGCNMMMAQTVKEDSKNRVKTVKALDKATIKKIETNAKKEAKSLAKEGWKPASGSQPIAEQLYDFYTKDQQCRLAEDNGYMPKYIFGSQQARGTNYSAARKQAMELARVDLAGQISSKVAEITNMSTSNGDKSDEEVVSFTKSVSESKTLVQQNLGRVSVVYEAVKEEDHKFTVAIRLQYVTTNLKNTLATQLEKMSEKTRAELEDMLAPAEVEE